MFKRLCSNPRAFQTRPLLAVVWLVCLGWLAFTFSTRRVSLLLLLFTLCAVTALAQTTSFTYQGRLTDGGTPANGNYDLQFALFDSVAGGAQIGATQTSPNVSVSAGIFTVQLDFGATAFPGANRFLEISARPTGTATFTVLSPRQPITATPYAVRALSAANAENLTTAGSGNFIQNAATPQASASFNVGGNGTVGGTMTGNIVNAVGQFNLGGSRVVGLGPDTSLNNFLVGLNAGNALVDGRENTFVGSGAGQAATGGPQDCPDCGPGGTPLYRGSHSTFVGYRAGSSNTSGAYNSFFGSSAGASSTTTSNNSLFGSFAGVSNTATSNSFFGSFAGSNNTTGSNNAFFGTYVGFKNVAGVSNAFFGSFVGSQNTGSQNSFFGSDAGSGNTTGSFNSFLGYNAGAFASSGSSNNNLIGAWAQLGADNLNNATAIGARATVGQSNTLVLGSIAGVNLAPASVNVGIGTTVPQLTLHVAGSGIRYQDAGRILDITAGSLTDITARTTSLVIQSLGAGASNHVILNPFPNSGAFPNGNVGIGTFAPNHKLSVIGGPQWTSNLWTGSMEFANASAIGWQGNTAGWHFGIGQSTGGLYFFQTSSDLGSTLSPVTYDLVVTDGGNVGIGTTTPDRKLSVNGGASKMGGGSWDSFSDERLKTIKGRFTGGLKAVMQLQPLRYEYKQDNALGIDSPGEHIGFGAQAVQKIIPEAVSKNDKGYLLINNDPIMWTMLNAIKEQQTQIETLRTANAELKARLRAVENVVRKRVGSSGRRR